MAEPQAIPLLKSNGQPTGMVMCPICNAVISADDDYRNHHPEGERRPTSAQREEAEQSAEMLLHPELLSTPIATLHPEMTEEQLAVLNMESPVVAPDEPHHQRTEDKKDN